MTSLALCGTLDDQRGRVHAHLKKFRLVPESFFLQVFLKVFYGFLCCGLLYLPGHYLASLCSYCGPHGGSTSAATQGPVGTSTFDEPKRLIDFCKIFFMKSSFVVVVVVLSTKNILLLKVLL